MSEKRAINNRTLRLSEGEKARLRPKLLTPEALQAGAGWLNRTLHADLLNVLPQLPDEMADLIIIDPPYNLTKRFGGRTFTAMSAENYKHFLQTWFHSVCRKLKPNGSLYVCGDWKSTAALQEVISEELTILNRITWQREKGRGARHNWKNAMEDIWFAVKSESDYYFDVQSVMMRRRVLAPYRENGKAKDWDDTSDGKFRTTCPDVVFDPFLGSGTTSVVAKKLGRQFCGVEIDEDYCLLAERRLELAETDPSIQGYNDGVFWERNTLAAQQAMQKKRQAEPAQQLILFN